MSNMTPEEIVELAEEMRPGSLEDFIADDKFKKTIEKIIKKPTSILLHGTYGIGKTTLAKIIQTSLTSTYMFINASDERNIADVRGLVDFGAMASEELKVVILDEADNFTPDAYKALRGVIEQSVNTVFLLTANYPNKIPGPIKSRCKPITLPPMTAKGIFKFVVGGLVKRAIGYDPKEILAIIEMFFPDVRSVLKTIQLSIDDKDNTVKIDIDAVIESDVKIGILKHLKTKDLQGIRELMKTQNVTDYPDIFRYIFDNLHLYFEDPKLAKMQILVAEYLYKDAFVPIQEINLSACLLNLIKNM